MERHPSWPLLLFHSVRGTVPVRVLRDQRGDGRGRAVLVKRASVVLGAVIDVRHAVELAQIVQPGLGHKCLDMAIFIGRVAREEPAEGFVSFAHSADLVHSAEEVLGLIWVDAVLDLYHDGTFL